MNRTYNIFLWDVASRQLIGNPLTAHSYNIEDLAMSPDGRTFVSAGASKPNGIKGTGGSAKTVRLWSMDLESWIADACRVANRNLTHAEWEKYFPGETYHKSCPNLPEPKE